MKPEHAETKHSSMNRRRWALLAVVLVALVVTAAYTVKHLVNVDRFRPRMTEAVETATGLPARVNEIELAFLPWPHVEVHALAVGEGDFRAEVERVRVSAKLRSLLGDTIEITEVRVTGLTLNVPEAAEALQTHVDAIRKAVEEREAPEQPSKRQVRVGAITTRNARIYLGEGEDELAAVVRISADLADPSHIPVTASARVPLLGEDARLDAECDVSPATAPLAKGRIELTGVAPAQAMAAAGLKARLSAAFEAKDKQTVTADLSGRTDAPPQFDALAGDFTANASWQEGALKLADVKWETSGGRVEARAVRTADGALDARLTTASLSTPTLKSLLTLFSPSKVRLRATEDASFTANDIHLASPAGGAPRLTGGTVNLDGVKVELSDGQTVFASLNAQATITEDALLSVEVNGDGLKVQGTASPDFTAKTVALDLRGSLDMSPERLALVAPDAPVQELGGALEITEATATLGKGEGVPEDLSVSAAVNQGRITLALGDEPLALEQVNLASTVVPEKANIKLDAQSPQAGPLSADLAYVFTEKRLGGQVTADLERMAPMLPLPDAAGPYATAALASYGTSAFQTELNLAPEGKDQVLTLNLKRAGDTPKLVCDLALAKREKKTVLARLAVDASIAAQGMYSALPPQASAEGPVRLTLSQSLDEQRFDIGIDATDCTLVSGEYVKKRPGDETRVAVAGSVTPEAWNPETMNIVFRGETVQGQFAEEGLRFEDLDVDVAPFAALLPEGATASGHIRGSAAAEPMKLDLRLDAVGFKLNEELGVDSMTGGLAYQNAVWTVKDLRILSANSDFEVDAGLEGDTWRADVRGEKLDLNSVLALVDAAQSFQAGPTEEMGSEIPEEAAGSAQFSGEFVIAIDDVLYRRGHLKDVQVDIKANGESVRVEPIKANIYEGTLAASAIVEPGSGGGANVLRIDADVKDVDARLLDDLFFETPREMRGLITAKAAVNGPLEQGSSFANGLNGTMSFEARDGSFGKVGLASALLAALRTTEVLRLRLPQLKDASSLTYDTCSGNLTADTGVLTLEEFDLVGPSLSIVGSGTINIPESKLDLTMRARPMEAVTGLVEKVPIVGGAAGKLREGTGVALAVSGSLTEPKVNVAPLASITGPVTKPVEEAGKLGGSILRNVLQLDKKDEKQEGEEEAEKESEQEGKKDEESAPEQGGGEPE